MNKKLLFIAVLVCNAAQLYARADVWQKVSANLTISGERVLYPDKYNVFALDIKAIRQELATLSVNANDAQVLALPTPTGTYRSFKVWQTPVLDNGIATRYPAIKTFTAFAEDNPNVTAKIDVTPAGLHAMVFDGTETFFIDPYARQNDQYYLVYYKKDYSAGQVEQFCQLPEGKDELLGGGIEVGKQGLPQNNYITNGAVQRTYRLAMACTQEYSNAVVSGTPTKPDVLAAIVTSVNRVNGVYERELAVTLQLVNNTDDLIYLAEPDPFTNGSVSTMLGQNQTNTNNVIGSLNYDIGHVFGTGTGGIANLGGVCRNTQKARGATARPNPVGDPFDIDYVAHEIGHQFGAEHTFNSNTGSCNNNGEPATAFEPGSGSTIMAYAGICGSTNNLQANSDAYFHFISLTQISDFITTGFGATCASSAPSGNTPSVVPSILSNYSIPALTPFELTAPTAVDIDHQELTYCWEQADLGDFQQNFSSATLGPIFRSFSPDSSLTRVFPTLSKLLAGTTNYLGEKLPSTDRTMLFKLTVRDINNGIGCFNISDDEVNIDVINTGSPFYVKHPTASTEQWYAGSQMDVEWEVAGTTNSPINCSSVDIYLSVDGGYTYPYMLAQGTANDGIETVTVPAVSSENARVKVKGAGNVFFNISENNFRVHAWSTSASSINNSNNIIIYPVPAKNTLNIEYAHTGANATIVNALGQQVWNGNINANMQLDIQSWAPGMYNLRVIDGDKTINRNFIVQ